MELFKFFPRCNTKIKLFKMAVLSINVYVRTVEQLTVGLAD